MNNIGLFEAKTKLSEICDKVMKERQPVIITKHGKPLVRIDPLEKEEKTIWDIADKFRKTEGSITDDFVLPVRNIDNIKNPID